VIITYPRTPAEAVACVADLDRAVRQFRDPLRESDVFKAQELLVRCGFTNGSDEAAAAFNLLDNDQHRHIAELARTLWRAQARLLRPDTTVSSGHMAWVMAVGSTHWNAINPWEQDPGIQSALAMINAAKPGQQPTKSQLEALGVAGAIYTLAAVLQNDITRKLNASLEQLGTSKDKVWQSGSGTFVHYQADGANAPNVVHFEEDLGITIVFEAKANTSRYKTRGEVDDEGVRYNKEIRSVAQNSINYARTLANALLANKSRDLLRRKGKVAVGAMLRTRMRQGRCVYFCVRTRCDPIPMQPQIEHRLFAREEP
jgi:hypothetical protein